MLTGAEFNINEKDFTVPFGKTYHLNFISKKPENPWQPWIRNPKEAAMALVKDNEIDAPFSSYSYDIDCINRLIARAKEKDCFVFYNHPVWSQQNYTDYAGLKGLWGMEVCNYSSCRSGYDDNNGNVYHELSVEGNRLFPVGADDAHSLQSACGAWIMVSSDALEYSSVIEALEKGDFYASTGPEIHSLSIENGIVHVRCSEASRVTLRTSYRTSKGFTPDTPNGLTEEATFDINDWLAKMEEFGRKDVFFRVTVTDAQGNRAYTRAFWLDEFI